MFVLQRSLLCLEKIVSILLSICSVIDPRKEKKSVTDDIICDKKKKNWLMRYYRISLMLLYFDMFCDLLLNRAVAIWKHFVL